MIKNKAESKKEQATKYQTAKAPTSKRNGTSKIAKESKANSEPTDRLPADLDELKAGKAGLATYLFLSGKDKDVIAAELKTAFKLPDPQAVKITRRILGRVRFFQRALSLVAPR